MSPTQLAPPSQVSLVPSTTSTLAVPSNGHIPSSFSNGSTSTSNTNMSATTGSTSIPNASNASNSDPDISIDPDGDAEEEISQLNVQLVREYRILEGAENLLKMDLAEPTRKKVVPEMEMARRKITAIKKLLDICTAKRERQLAEEAVVKQRLEAQTNLNTGTSSAASITNTNTSGNADEVELENDRSAGRGEDFRTALQNAHKLLAELNSLTQSQYHAKPPSPPASSTSPTTPSTSASSKSRPYPRRPSDLHPAATVEMDKRRIALMNRLVGILQRNLRVRYELDVTDVLDSIVYCLADKCSKTCRAAAYRLIRHALVDSKSVHRLGHALDWYLLKSLNRDAKSAVEKEQAIKLVRTLIEVGSTRRDASGTISPIPVSDAIMRSIVAVAEHLDDPFRLVCIETLVEILLIDIESATRTGCLRLLLQVLGEGPGELGPMLAAAFLQVVDSPRTRKYLRIGCDLEVVLSIMTDAYGKGPDHAERMRGCSKVIQLMLWSWSGLMYFSIGNMQAIRSVIDTLRLPSLETREIILDMFFELLNIKTLDWYQTFIAGRRLTMYRKSTDESERQSSVQDTQERSHQLVKLTDQYLALLVMILTKAGLCEALTSLLEETPIASSLSRKATLLLAEILTLANRVLPMNAAANVQAIPQVFSMATDYAAGERRIIGTSALSAIESFNRNRSRLDEAIAFKNLRPRANSVEDSVRRGQRQVEQVKAKMSMQMDDRAFQTALIETQVMQTKDFTKWNYDALQDLVDRLVYNPRRLEEVIKARFVRRLMAFFSPFSHRFSDIRKDRDTVKWVKLGCSLLTTLMLSGDGIRYLSTEDQFLSQIVKGFAQLDPFNGLPDSDPIFSKRRVGNTLTYGYFEMLGTLSKYEKGIELLEKFKIFTAFYHLSELRSREDLIKCIIENLDYSIDGHPRIVLSKALTSSYQHIRLFATQHLVTLIRSSTNANAWTLRLLLTQLYDPAPEIKEVAVQFLEEVCEEKEFLQMVVELQPAMSHLGEIGDALLMKFMSTPMGFRYLYDAGHIDREMDTWFHERNLVYVIDIEIFLAKLFNTVLVIDDEDDLLASVGTIPHHFYGELAKTDFGCQVLREKGHFKEFSQIIKQHSLEEEDMELIMRLKSILWAVGNVGAAEGGLPFLEEEEIIPAILEIAEKSPIPSVRGTCFFVLGLISSTSQGVDILEEYDWQATLSPLGLPTGVCLPTDLDKFISIPPWEQCMPQRRDVRLIPPTLDYEIEIATAMQNMANTVIANAASRSLAKIRSRPEYSKAFSSPDMLYRALHMISTQRFRLPVRRYIVDLFNLQLNPELVEALERSEKSLKAHPSYKPPSSAVGRISMFGRLGRTGTGSESSGSEDEDISPKKNTTSGLNKEQRPVFTLRPLQRIVGFDV